MREAHVLKYFHMQSFILTAKSCSPSLSLSSVLEVREAKIMSVMDVCADDIHTLLLAVQMKFTVDPTVTLCCLGSSIKTSIGLDGKAGEGKKWFDNEKRQIQILQI